MSNSPKNKANTQLLQREGPADYIILSTETDPIPSTLEAGAILEYSDTGDRFRWSSTAWFKTGSAGAQVSIPFFLEVSRDNVPGFDTKLISALNPLVGSVTEEDIWEVGGQLVYPTAGEQWEIVSDSVNDAAAGTGTRTVLILYLDNNYERQTETVTLNGTTPVSTVATDMFRFDRMLTTTAGSLNKNDGDITIRVVSAGNPRGVIVAGNNITRSIHYTVPAGKKAYIYGSTFEINKGEDVMMIFHTTQGESPIFLRSSQIFIYQSHNRANLVFPTGIREKSDFKMTAISSNAVAAPFVFLEILEIDD